MELSEDRIKLQERRVEEIRLQVESLSLEEEEAWEAWLKAIQAKRDFEAREAITNLQEPLTEGDSGYFAEALSLKERKAWSAWLKSRPRMWKADESYEAELEKLNKMKGFHDEMES